MSVRHDLRAEVVAGAEFRSRGLAVGEHAPEKLVAARLVVVVDADAESAVDPGGGLLLRQRQGGHGQHARHQKFLHGPLLAMWKSACLVLAAENSPGSLRES